MVRNRRVRTGSTVAAVVLVAGVMALVAACAPQPGGPSGPASSWSIDPAATDPQLPSDTVSPNLAYLPTGPEAGRLSVILPGTGAGTSNFGELSGALRQAGHHVIVLRYSNSLGTPAACPDAAALTDPDCFRTFRSEVTFGASVPDPDGASYDHPVATVDGPRSVTNRLLELLEHLNGIAPTAGWDQFQLSTGGTCDQVDANYGACAADWSKVTAVGHSQGAGVGLYLAKFFPLDRVVMLSGAFDAYHLGGTSYVPAPWITEAPLAVAPADVSTFFHTSDVDLGRMRSVADAVGVPGAEVSVNGNTPPYGSNRLITSVGSTCPWDPYGNHNSTAVDICTPDLAYDAAWTELVTS